jgi:hypothetical protein
MLRVGIHPFQDDYGLMVTHDFEIWMERSLENSSINSHALSRSLVALQY